MRKHILNLLVREVDLVYGVSPVLQRNVVAVDVRRKEDFYKGHAKLVTRLLAPSSAVSRLVLGSIPGFHMKPWADDR